MSAWAWLLVAAVVAVEGVSVAALVFAGRTRTAGQRAAADLQEGEKP